MQKFVTIFVTCAYLLFSIGINVSIHFCGGEIVSFKLFKKAESCVCKMPKKEVSKNVDDNNNCCNNETKVFKTDDNLKSHFSPKFKNVSYAIWQIAPLFFITHENKFISWVNSSFNTFFYKKIPPPKTSFWLLFCVLRI